MMKQIKNKALWLPRLILIIAYAVIGYVGILFSMKSPDIFSLMAVITLILIVLFLYALTYFQPLYSALSNLILFALLYFLLRSSFSVHTRLMAFGVNLYAIAVWMILAASSLVILSIFFPHMLDNIEFSKW